ncbi:hypothetical protein OHT57_18170 [Streptomyces sp. NBC_00285]|uniref:hypothetical protein n=1 Tax=Streptomyces sp. NBC_00285 TaxID=2975700 RepID=UPI002E2C051E|nr:hypothetical protein [Streptomyces sp. NBC_00285]
MSRTGRSVRLSQGRGRRAKRRAWHSGLAVALATGGAFVLPAVAGAAPDARVGGRAKAGFVAVP